MNATGAGPTAYGKDMIAKALAVLVVCTPAIYADAVAQVKMKNSDQFELQDADLFDRIDKEVSRFPFDMTEEEARELNIDGVTFKQTDDVSELIDEAGVRHDFFEGLYGKTINVDPSEQGKPVEAMGIGMARSRTDVAAAFERYSGGKQLKCSHRYEQLDDKTTKESDGFYCDFPFHESYDVRISFLFDAQGQLIKIYAQKWYPF